MNIECTIRRKNGTHPEIDGITYHFMPIVTGEHVAVVNEPAAIERFLSIDAYREFRKGPLKYVGESSAAAPVLVGTLVATPNVADLDREGLFAYAAEIGMRKPHPAISDEKLRANVMAFLELRAGGEEPVGEGEQDDDQPDDDQPDGGPGEQPQE